MAALSITAASVVASTAATLRSGTAGETITAGQPIYLKEADSKLYKTVNTSSAAATAVGVAINGASNGQPLNYAEEDSDLTIGATPTAGEIYCVGAAGEIIPQSDLIAGNYVTTLGVGKTGGKLVVKLHASGIAKA